MPDTTNFSFTLPAASDTGWAGTLNDGIQEIDTQLWKTAKVNGNIQDGMVATTAALANEIVTAAKIANRTRKFLVPAVAAYDVTNTVTVNRDSDALWRMADSADTMLSGNFFVPSDYVESMTIKAVIQSPATGNVYGKNVAYQGAAGEAFDTHTTTTGNAAEAVTKDVIDEGFTLTMSSVAAADYVTLMYDRYADNALDTVNDYCYFFGWIVSYTADS